MKVTIGIGARAPGLTWMQEGELQDVAGEKLNPGFTTFRLEDQIATFSCDPADASRALLLRQTLANAFPPGSIIAEGVIIDKISNFEKNEVEFFISHGFADDFSDAEKGDYTQSWCVCPKCGNKYQDPAFVPKAIASRLRPNPLGAFYSHLKMFCTPEFIKTYEREGVTGLNFERWGDLKDRNGNTLYLVRSQHHRWQDRDGVCDECEMKTNVTSPDGCFNVHERFVYDFQYLRSFCPTGQPTERFVLSRRAIDLLLPISETMRRRWEEEPMQLVVPILPGYMEDLIWPEPRLCTPESPPLYMLRKNWEAAAKDESA